MLFTDVRLGGWDLNEASRHKHKLPEIPVIYATGHAIEPQRGVDGSLFFGKPDAPEQIRAASEQWLKGRKSG